MTRILTIEEVLADQHIMNELVAFERNKGDRWMGLFERFCYETYENLARETDCGIWMDFEPYYTHIAKGEYGNCVLLLYRYKCRFSEQEKREMAKGLRGKERADMLRHLELEQRSVFGMYSYQYKGMIETEWFSALLAEEIEIED